MGSSKRENIFVKVVINSYFIIFKIIQLFWIYYTLENLKLIGSFNKFLFLILKLGTFIAQELA